ncbi:hypothetical protein N9E91_03080 [Alphaproteobacteria bacterium]|nr:hypothetical protein [Alphaproteobacteria bacterium]
MLIALSVIKRKIPDADVVLCGPLAGVISSITNLKIVDAPANEILLPSANLTAQRLIFTYLRNKKYLFWVNILYAQLMARMVINLDEGNFYYREYAWMLYLLLGDKSVKDGAIEALTTQKTTSANADFDYVFPGASKIEKTMRPQFWTSRGKARMITFDNDQYIGAHSRLDVVDPSKFDFSSLEGKKIFCCDTSLAHIIYYKDIDCQTVVYFRGSNGQLPLPPSKKFQYVTDYCVEQGCMRRSRSSYAPQCRICHHGK